jgi:tRNA(Ile)-lysidine synthase
VTEQLPSGPELHALSNKLLASFPLECWQGRASRAIKESEGGKIAVACSGGADSTFALLLIHAAFPQCRENIHVLHYNHRLRADSDEDEDFVAKLAQRLDLTCSTCRSGGPNPKVDEGTLRNERLSSFIDFCQRSKTDLIVQGHNQDDVAETIIWRLSRGSSPQGLCAPRPVHKHGEVHIVRPFISISREDIRSGLAEIKMPWREDCTNQSLDYLRNRIRMNGLRLLKDDVDRNLLRGMSRSRELLEEQEDAMEEWVRLSQSNCVRNGGIDAIELSKIPVAIRRRIIYNWLSGESPAAAISSNQMEQILECIDSGEKLVLSLSPNTKIESREGLIVLKNDKRRAPGWPLCSFPQNQPLCLPDKNFVRFTTLKTTPSLTNRILSGQVDTSREAFVTTQGSPPLVFFARTRLPGDAYRPIGAPGRKKVKNWMIDRKLDTSLRDSIPLIMNSAGEIIWIPGLPPAESHRVEASEKMVIHLTYEHSATYL